MPLKSGIRMWSLILVVMISALSGCDPRYGLIENELRLAPESRLPIWFSNPSNYSRAELTMTITTYSSSTGFKTRLVVHGPGPDHKVLMDKVGTKRSHPTTIQQGENKYPLYAIIAIDGTEEVFEQRRPEPYFYISDDPNLTKGLKR